MYTKYFTLLLTFFFFSIFGQLRLELKVSGSVANVTIHNNSQENYVLPLDKSHFRPYELDCDAFSDYEEEFPSFGLMINLVNPDDKKEDYVVGYNRNSELNTLVRKVNVKRDSLKKKIVAWGKKNNIKDYSSAFINYNIMSNLIHLQSGEKVSFQIRLDLYNVTAQELIFYNYFLENSKKYKFYLSLCDFKEIDKYLTHPQKNKLKKYKFLTTKLESNTIDLRIQNNSLVN